MSKHNREKDYYEIRALLTLEKFFKKEYGNLIRSESPDLISENREIGIEITRTVNNQSEQEHKIISKEIMNNSLTDIDREKIEFVQKSGKQIQFAVINGEKRAIGYSDFLWHTNKLVIDTIVRKIELINKGKYQITKHLDLYVFSDSFNEYDDTDINEIMNEILNVQSKYDIKLRYIFFDDLCTLYLLDLLNKKINSYDMNCIIHDICVKAKKEAGDC